MMTSKSQVMSIDTEQENTPGSKTESYLVEQYASQVLDFSTQYGSDTSFSYTAANCLGVPSKFPAYGDFPQTFVTKEFGTWWDTCPSGKFRSRSETLVSCDDGNEQHFIDLKFEHMVYAHAVYIYETLNPGTITSIWGGNCKGKWQQIWQGKATKLHHQPRAFCPPIQSTDFPINQIRIHFDQQYVGYFTEIDAVALLGTTSPSTAESRLLASLPPPDKRGPILRHVVKMRLHRKVSLFHSFDFQGLGQTLIDQAINGLGDDINGPFDRLPREVIFHIFQYLNLYTLVQCFQVSKLFYQVASDPMLYVRLDLKSLFYCVSNETLKFLYGRTQYLTSLDLSWCGNYGRITPLVLRTFLYGRGSNLSRLILSNCHVATNPVIAFLARTCKNLVELNLSNCHILEMGSFSELSHLQSLKYLNLYRTQVTQSEIRGILMANRGLQHLNVASCSKIKADEVCRLLSHCNKTLISLDLWRTPDLTSRGVTFLGRGLPLLAELDLGWCLGVNTQQGCIATLVTGCPNLVKLFLTAHRQTSDAELRLISENLFALEQLSIMGTRNVTPGAVLALAKSLTSLKLLDIGYCEQLENQPFLSELHTILPSCHIVTSFNQN